MSLPETENSSLFVSQEEAQKRYDICKECDRFMLITTQCKECGCVMKIKAKIRSSECPLKKWMSL